jgi:RNA polymerase sigma-70 factor, ECF subfamily
MTAVSSAHSAFSQRFLCHLPELRARAARLTGVRSDADDLVQQTLERALRFSRGLDEHTNPRAWLLRTMFNLFVDERRQKSRMRPLSAFVEARLPTPQPYEPAAWEMLGESELWRAIDQLPEHQREALRLSAREGHTYREIGDVLGIPAATVGTRLLRARVRVRRLLESPTQLATEPRDQARCQPIGPAGGGFSGSAASSDRATGGAAAEEGDDPLYTTRRISATAS